MMRSSNSKVQGKVEAVNSESPLENGLPSKEEDEMDQDVREVAAKVVENVIKMASEAAQEKSQDHPSTTKSKVCVLPRLPTIQIDTVVSAPSSPVDWSPIEESNEFDEIVQESNAVDELVEELNEVNEPVQELNKVGETVQESNEADKPLDESEIQLELDTGEQETDTSKEDLTEFLKSYVEDILSQAMVVAEKKLQFVGLPEDDDEEEDEESVEQEPSRSLPELGEETEKEIDDSEIQAAAQKVVEEVISKATELVAERSGKSPELSFPIKFEEASEDVKEAAEAFVKEIIGKAVTMIEEKNIPPLPFNFEDVDTMKSSGPWYVRAREAFIRLLRTACFCTPRRTDS